MNTSALRSVLARTGPLLLDFDGPVCSVFAGLPATLVARELVSELTRVGVETGTVEDESDPMEVLRWTASLGDPELTLMVDLALRDAEIRAIPVAAPTPYADELISAALVAGRSLAVASNNSPEAITAYLGLHGYTEVFAVVAGRTHGRPDLMKPDPYSLTNAANGLMADIRQCAFIGDTVSDIEAARRVGAASIGYANKPGKARRLAGAGADAVVESLGCVAECLRESVDQSDGWASRGPDGEVKRG